MAESKGDSAMSDMGKARKTPPGAAIGPVEMAAATASGRTERPEGGPSYVTEARMMSETAALRREIDAITKALVRIEDVLREELRDMAGALENGLEDLARIGWGVDRASRALEVMALLQASAGTSVPVVPEIRAHAAELAEALAKRTNA